MHWSCIYLLKYFLCTHFNIRFPISNAIYSCTDLVFICLNISYAHTLIFDFPFQMRYTDALIPNLFTYFLSSSFNGDITNSNGLTFSAISPASLFKAWPSLAILCKTTLHFLSNKDLIIELIWILIEHSKPKKLHHNRETCNQSRLPTSAPLITSMVVFIGPVPL